MSTTKFQINGIDRRPARTAEAAREGFVKRAILGSVLMGVMGALVACTPVGTQGCGSDVDCSPGRVCEQGVCVDQDTSSGSAESTQSGTGSSDETGTQSGPATDPSASGSESASGSADESGSSETGFEGDPVATDCDTCLDNSDADNRSVTCRMGASGEEATLVFSGDRPVSYDGIPCAPVVWTDVFTESCFGAVTCGTCELDLSFGVIQGEWDVIVACDSGFGTCPATPDTPTAVGPTCLNCGDDGLHYCDGDQLRRCTDDELVLDCVGQQECWPVPSSPASCFDNDTGSTQWSGPGCYNFDSTQPTCLP